MRYYLLVYDRRAGRLLRDVVEFSGDEIHAALAERFRIEREDFPGQDVEIAVLGADSRKQLEATHARYFKTLEQLAASE